MTTLQDKVRFLSDPAAYPHAPASVDVVETHMSWVFMAGDRVYKFKKPVVFPFLDHRTLEARRRNCEVEYKINLDLARETYLGVLALTCRNGRLRLGGRGRVEEWLIVMRRLDRPLTLESKLMGGTLTPADVASIAERLVAHYLTARVDGNRGLAYRDHLMMEQDVNSTVLLGSGFDFAQDDCRRAIADLAQRFAQVRAEIEERIAAGLVVDGHGDLRPEHVWLGTPLQIFDRLEFDATMRLIDPYDELNYLGLECSVAGAGWVGPQLLDALRRTWGHPPSDHLLEFYSAFRLVLRARICMAHLLDAEPMTPARWPGAARAYLALHPCTDNPSIARASNGAHESTSSLSNVP